MTINFDDGTIDPSILDLSLPEARKQFERAYFQHHHARAGFNLVRAARCMGVAHSTAWRVARRLGIDTDPHHRDSALNPDERERREQAREAANQHAEARVAQKLYRDSIAERAGTADVRDIDADSADSGTGASGDVRDIDDSEIEDLM